MIMTQTVEELDLDKLAKYLADHIDGFDMSQGLKATKFEGGQSNPTFKIETAVTSIVLG